MALSHRPQTLILGLAGLWACLPAGEPYTPDEISWSEHPDASRLPSHILPFSWDTQAGAQTRPVAHPDVVAVPWADATTGTWMLAWAGLDQPWRLEPLDPPLASQEVEALDAIVGAHGEVLLAFRRANGEVLVYTWRPGEDVLGEQVAPYVQSAPSWQPAEDVWLDALPDGQRLVTFARPQPLEVRHAAIYVATSTPDGSWSSELAFAPEPGFAQGGRAGTHVVGALLPDGRPVVGVTDAEVTAWRWRLSPGTWSDLRTVDHSNPDFVGLDCPSCVDAHRDADGRVWLSPSLPSDETGAVPWASLAARGHQIRHAVEPARFMPSQGEPLAPGTVVGARFWTSPCGLWPFDNPESCRSAAVPPFGSDELLDPRDGRAAHGTFAAYPLALVGHRLVGGQELPHDPTMEVPYIPDDARAQLIDVVPPVTAPLPPSTQQIVLTLSSPYQADTVTCVSADPTSPNMRRREVTLPRQPAPRDATCEAIAVVQDERVCLNASQQYRCPQAGCLAPDRAWHCTLDELIARDVTLMQGPIQREPTLHWGWPAQPSAAVLPSPEPSIICLDEDACGCRPGASSRGLLLTLSESVAVDVVPSDTAPPQLLHQGEPSAPLDVTWQSTFRPPRPWLPATGAHEAVLRWQESLEPDTTYQVVLPPDLTDARNGLTWDASALFFDTGPGSMQVADVSPAPESMDVTLTTQVRLSLSLPIRVQDLTEVSLEGPSGPVPVTVTSDGPDITVTPLTPLAPETRYAITLTDNIASTPETCEQRLTTPWVSHFTTRAATP